jgi:hypothetical protein
MPDGDSGFGGDSGDSGGWGGQAAGPGPSEFSDGGYDYGSGDWGNSSSSMAGWGLADSAFPGSDSWGGAGSMEGWGTLGGDASGNFSGSDSFDPNGVPSSEDTSFFGKLSKFYSALQANPLGRVGLGALSMMNPIFAGVNGIASLANAGYQGKGASAMGNAFGNSVQNTFGGPLGSLASMSGYGLGNAMGSSMAGLNQQGGFGGTLSDNSMGGYGGGNNFSLGQTPYGAFNLSGGPASPEGGKGNWMDTVIGLGSLYGNYRNTKSMQDQAKSLSGMFSANSPYAKQLQQSLERRDAAAGRRSQYGPRLVELQAKLAGQAAGVAPAMFQAQQGANNANMDMWKSLAGLYRTGTFDPLQQGLQGLYSNGG